MNGSDHSPSEIQYQLQQMDPYEFEQLVADVWEAEGYDTTVRQKSDDRGIDVEAVKQQPFHQKVLIQAKRYSDSNTIGSEEVRKYATLYQQVNDADTVVIVTTGGFTNQAERLARDLDVKLVDGKSLAQMIANNDGTQIFERYNLNSKFGPQSNSRSDIDSNKPEERDSTIEFESVEGLVDSIDTQKSTNETDNMEWFNKAVSPEFVLSPRVNTVREIAVYVFGICPFVVVYFSPSLAKTQPLLSIALPIIITVFIAILFGLEFEEYSHG